MRVVPQVVAAAVQVVAAAEQVVAAAERVDAAAVAVVAAAVQVGVAAVQVDEEAVPVVGVLHLNSRYLGPEPQRVHGGAGEGGIEVNGCVPYVELPWHLFPLDDREAFCKQKFKLHLSSMF